MSAGVKTENKAKDVQQIFNAGRTALRIPVNWRATIQPFRRSHKTQQSTQLKNYITIFFNAQAVGKCTISQEGCKYPQARSSEHFRHKSKFNLENRQYLQSR